MFHEILESLDFEAVGRCAAPMDLFDHAPSRDRIEGRMEDHRLGAEWREGVADVIWNTLRAALPDPAGGRAFALCEVSQLRPEMEFLFPYPGRSVTGGSGDAATRGAGPDGYLWGFIDLVFRHRGRYYLLDWKSNHLEAYGPADLERSMRESRYDVQYMLYALALDKWLRSLIPDYRYEDHFGGVYYLYLRGIRRMPDPASSDPARISGTGVFALKPSLDQMAEAYPAHLSGMLGLSGTGGLSEFPPLRTAPHGNGSGT